MAGRYLSSSGMCRPGGVSGSCSDESSEDGVKGRDAGGVGGDGGWGKDGCGLDGGVPDRVLGHPHRPMRVFL